MELSKITARGQTTIPKTVRDAAGLREGDVLAFEVEGDHLVMRRLTPGQDDDLRSLSNTMTDWTSAEDETAWRDL